MRVALIRSRYTPFGGAERFVDRALQALAAQGDEVTLIARRWAGEPAPPIKRVVIDPAFPRWQGRTARDRAFALAVQSHLATTAYDIVQSHERIPGVMLFRAGDGVHAAWLEHRARAQPWVAWTARLSPYHRYVLAAEAAMFAAPQLRGVICNSTLVADELQGHYGLAPEKLVVIANGVDLDLFHPSLAAVHRGAVRRELRIDETAPVFLYVGSGYLRKGVPALLEAFARLGDAQARLLIVGADRKLPAYVRRAAALGLSGRVSFLGPQPDVRPYYAAADAFVLPTLYDPFPNAIVEALACGLPVVTSTTCGGRDLIRNGDNGYLVDALDIAALTAALAALAVPGAAAAMRPAARAAVGDLSLAAMAARLGELYARLAAGRPAAPGNV